MENVQYQSLIIKRVKKGRHGHHGGAWKVALADFATAMMALFLVLWIINSTNEQEREAIAGYFQDPIAWSEGKRVPSPYIIDLGGSPSVADNVAKSEIIDPEKVLPAEEIERLADAIERARQQELMREIQEQIDKSATLSPFKDQILLDITHEGLRIQIIDKTKRPMFDAGSDILKYYTEDILYELAQLIAKVPNKLSITGHTDATRFGSGLFYGNWELSSNRAHSARRALIDGGYPNQKLAQIVGMGDSVPFDDQDPGSAVNRRIALILLNKKEEEKIQGRGASEEQKKNMETIVREQFEKNKEEIKNIQEQFKQRKAEAEANPEREKALEETSEALDKLQKLREDADNPYDNPPKPDEEAFW